MRDLGATQLHLRADGCPLCFGTAAHERRCSDFGRKAMDGRLGIFAAVTMASAGLIGSATAQTYPDRIIELIVPATPGSSADILGRVLADGMGTALGQRIVVLNKVGAGGMLGTAEASRAKPDGYTLVHTAVYALTVQPLTEKQVSYTYKSFDPICQTFKNDMVIVARPNTYKDVADLLKASKAKTGGLNYGTPGVGTIPYLAMAEVSQITKIEFNNVPFRGPPETIQMTAAGQIDFAVAPLTAAAGSNLAMPGLFALKRNPSMPDVPTVIEQGYNVAPLSIGGLLAPAGLPADVKQKLDSACAAARASEAFQRIAKRTFQPSDYQADSAGFKANIDRDVEEKRRLLTALGLAK
jgi:tripartite-type tricarboxylate transporter receptor subunit TctC